MALVTSSSLTCCVSSTYPSKRTQRIHGFSRASLQLRQSFNFSSNGVQTITYPRLPFYKCPKSFLVAVIFCNRSKQWNNDYAPAKSQAVVCNGVQTISYPRLSFYKCPKSFLVTAIFYNSSKQWNNDRVPAKSQLAVCNGVRMKVFRPFLESFIDCGSFARSQPRLRSFHGGVIALSMEVAEEASLPNDETSRPFDVSHFPLPPKNRADDTSLHNPLRRLERMGCGWLGIILEWEGVMVEDDANIEMKCWASLAEEEGKRPPPAFIFKRSEGMKNEHAIAEVLCWSRDPREVKRLAQRKDELFQQMQGGIYRVRPGSKEFVLTLQKYNIPTALVSTRPRKILERAIEAVGMEGFPSVVVAAEDVYRGKPDPEMFLYAAQLLGFIPERCIVVGNSNQSVEAAHDAYMKCIALVGKHPVYELGAADLVVRRLDDLSVVDLKNLADLESPEFQPPQLEPEMVPEPEQEQHKTQTSIQDFW